MWPEAVGWPVIVVADDLKDCLHMAKMATRGGSAGLFAPFAKCGAEFGAGDVGWVDFVAAPVHVSDELFDAMRDWFGGSVDA